MYRIKKKKSQEKKQVWIHYLKESQYLWRPCCLSHFVLRWLSLCVGLELLGWDIPPAPASLVAGTSIPSCLIWMWRHKSDKKIKEWKRYYANWWNTETRKSTWAEASTKRFSSLPHVSQWPVTSESGHVLKVSSHMDPGMSVSTGKLRSNALKSSCRFCITNLHMVIKTDIILWWRQVIF